MIKIAQRFTPFSHLPGTSCPIPLSSWMVRAYPTLLQIYNDTDCHDLSLLIQGPVEGFTLLLDLERSEVNVFGRGQQGFFSLQLKGVSNGIALSLKRGVEIPIHFEGEKSILFKGTPLIIKTGEGNLEVFYKERLALGVSKKLDWDLVKRRGEREEIFPVLFFLGQQVLGDRIDIESDWELFFSAGFSNLLVPEREDINHLGLGWKGISNHISRASLLRWSYFKIREQFILQENDKVTILPTKTFHSGKMEKVDVGKGKLSMQWRSYQLRKVAITPMEDSWWHISFPKGIVSFRIRKSLRERGKIHCVNDPFWLQGSSSYFLDNFQR